MQPSQPQITAIPELQDVPILVVDDLELHRLALVEQLTAWGMRPVPFGDAQSAHRYVYQAQLEGQPIRALLIDHDLPDLAGNALGEQIGRDTSLKTPHLLLMVSGQRMKATQQITTSHFSAYLSKPLRMVHLRAWLMRVLAPTSRNVAEGGGRVEGDDATLDNGSLPILADQAPETRRKARILLAEDNAVNQKVALRVLERMGFRAEAVADGTEVMRALATAPYDLVLMDVQMPIMDGFQATQAIRAGAGMILNPNIPIIAMTAHAMQGDRELCLAAGMNDYVSKPVQPHLLEAKLAQWLGKQATVPDEDSSPHEE